jgi:hypothetical protein
VNNNGTNYVRIMKQTEFGRKKYGEYIPCLKYSIRVFLNKYIKCNCGGWRCGTPTIVGIRPLKFYIAKLRRRKLHGGGSGSRRFKFVVLKIGAEMK